MTGRGLYMAEEDGSGRREDMAPDGMDGGMTQPRTVEDHGVRRPEPDASTHLLPPGCAPALLDRFRRAEAMALWAIRAARAGPAPAHAQDFLRRHEQEECEHLELFERLTGAQAWSRRRLPRMPTQWSACAVQLFGYEALGLEFARLLVTIRPELSAVAEEEEGHVAFFAREVEGILASGGRREAEARIAAGSWWRRLPRTVDRYLQGEELAPHRAALAAMILAGIADRFRRVGLSDELTEASRT